MPVNDLSQYTDTELDEMLKTAPSRPPTPQAPSTLSQVLQFPMSRGVRVPGSLTPEPPPKGIDVDTGAPAWERTLASFYGSPQGKQYVLSKKYGEENTRINNGFAEFNNPRTGKWTRIDPSGLDAGDVLDIVGDLPEITLGVLSELGGGVAGTMALGPGGTVPGAVVGAGFGQSGGAALKRLAQTLIGRTEKYEPLIEFAIGAGSELVGRGVTKGAKKLLKPTAIKPGIKAAVSAAESAGIPLTTAQKTGLPGIAKAQSFIERFPFSGRSGGVVERGVGGFGEFVQEGIENRFSKKSLAGIPQHALNENDMGETLIRAFEGRLDDFGNYTHAEYGKLWNDGLLTGRGTVKAKIKHTKTIEVATKIKDMMERAGRTNETPYRLVKFISEDPRSLEGSTLQELNFIRSNVLKNARSISRAVDQGKFYAQQLVESIGDDMERWGKDFFPTSLRRLKELNKEYADEMGIMFDEHLGGLIDRVASDRASPESVARGLLSESTITRTKKIKNIVGSDVWKDVEGYVIKDIVDRGMIPAAGGGQILSPAKLSRAIEKMSEAKMEAVFSRGQIRALKNWSRVGSLFRSQDIVSLAGNPSGTGQAVVKHKMVMDLLYSLGIGGGTVAATGSAPAAAAAIATPPILSSILQSKPMQKYLADGFYDLSKPQQTTITNVARSVLTGIINTQLRKSKIIKPKHKIPAPSLKGL